MRAPLQEVQGLVRDVVVVVEDVLTRRAVLLAPPAAHQHAQLVVPARARQARVHEQTGGLFRSGGTASPKQAVAFSCSWCVPHTGCRQRHAPA